MPLLRVIDLLSKGRFHLEETICDGYGGRPFGIKAERRKSVVKTRDTKGLNPQGNRSCILVLGMDAPATFAVARVLNALGCDLPHSVGSPSESDDAFGSLKIQDFNDQLLASAGSASNDFTPFYSEWLHSPRAAEFLENAVSLLEEEFGTSHLFVLSDPRICRLVPFWVEALTQFGCTTKLMLIHRDPIHIAPLGQMTWLRYELDAERDGRGMTRFPTSVEALSQDWQGVAHRAQQMLDLVWPKSTANAEFEVAAILSEVERERSDSLTRPEASNLLPDWLRETHSIFESWSSNGELATDYERLDRLRAEFDVASSAFGRVIRASVTGRVDMRSPPRPLHKSFGGTKDSHLGSESLKTLLQEQRRQTTLLNAELQQQIEAREVLQSQIIEAQAEVEASRARRKEMARVIANRESKIAQLNAELATRYEELAALQRFMLRSNPLWWGKIAVRRVGRAVKRPSEKVFS